MKATYDTKAPTSFTASHRREKPCYFRSYQVISLAAKPYDGSCHPVAIELRIYGTDSQATACLWVHHGDTYTQGSGKAGGYGCHRASAAAGAAIRSAGFTLSEGIHGAGESAIHEALLALAKCLKIRRPAMVESYQ